MPFLMEHVPGSFKATLPSPAMASRGGFQQGLTDAVYPTRHDLLRDLLPIYQDEVIYRHDEANLHWQAIQLLGTLRSIVYLLQHRPTKSVLLG